MCLKHQTKFVWWQYFVLKKFITLETILLLSAGYIWQHLHLVMERIMALQQNDWQEKHFLFCRLCPVFYLGHILSVAPLKIALSGTKFVQLWLTIGISFKNVGDNRKFVLKNSYFASVGRPFKSKFWVKTSPFFLLLTKVSFSSKCWCPYIYNLFLKKYCKWY